MCIALNGKRDLIGCDIEQIAVWSLASKMSARQLFNLLSCMGIAWTGEEMKQILTHRHRIAELPDPVVSR